MRLIRRIRGTGPVLITAAVTVLLSGVLWELGSGPADLPWTGPPRFRDLPWT